LGPVAADHVNREVLIDHDHDECRSGLVVRRLIAAQERVGGQIGIERHLKLVGQVASGDAPEQLATLRRKPRITGAATATSPFEQILTDSHAQVCRLPATRWSYRQDDSGRDELWLRSLSRPVPVTPHKSNP
jgi:hypothetical protein